MKRQIAILFGGKSPEHKISLLSARSVLDNIDKSIFEPLLIGIDDTGVWRYYGKNILFINEGNATDIALPTGGEPIYFSQNAGVAHIARKSDANNLGSIDAVFPVLHGLHGEDGSVQGLMKLANVPCVGCGLLGSAICMDKDVAKRLLRDAGVRIADFVTLRKGYNDDMPYSSIIEQLGEELYIKPANLGSSVGVSFVDNEHDFEEAMTLAFSHDSKVVVEEKIVGREIECAILGNQQPEASAIGEIAPTSEFYTFDSKYVDKDDASLSIPASLPDEISDKAKNLAKESFVVCECRGFARVDMFLKEDGSLILNEINTIPGFTNISMYPKLWAYEGIKYTDLITKLIELAVDHHNNTRQ